MNRPHAPRRSPKTGPQGMKPLRPEFTLRCSGAGARNERPRIAGCSPIRKIRRTVYLFADAFDGELARRPPASRFHRPDWK